MAGGVVAAPRTHGAALCLVVLLECTLGPSAVAQDGGACTSEAQLPEESQAEAESEAELLNVMLLQTGLRPPHSNVAKHEQHFPWDAIWRRAKKDIRNVAGNISAGAVSVVVQEVESAMDQLDSVVTEFADRSLDAETRFVDKLNATTEEKVETIKARANSLTTNAQDLWKNVASKVLAVQGVVVGFTETIGEMDTAEHLNASFNMVVSKVEEALESSIKIVHDAEALTANTASCGVVTLNSTVGRGHASVVTLARLIGEAFNETSDRIGGLVRSKVPEFAVGPVLELLTAMRQRSLVSSANLLRIEGDADANIIAAMDSLQSELLTLGHGCPEKGGFAKFKRFFRRLFHR